MDKWIPVSERLPELNRPLLVTTYHRVYYGHLISESGSYGYPVFRIHGLGDKNRDWVQETMSHEPYSLGRIDAWMYLDIPEPYKVEPQESEDEEQIKVGTKVRTIKDKDFAGEEVFPVETIGVVEEIREDEKLPYKIRANLEYWYYSRDMFEVIEDIEPQERGDK